MNLATRAIFLASGALMLGACTTYAGPGTRTAVQQERLETFDRMDFQYYSNQNWDAFSRSHAADVIVHYPDGSTTTGLAPHIEKLKPQFAFAPDTHIDEHPIKLADGDYTAVKGYLEGTFTQPMDMGDGNVVQPTGKAFRLPMVTMARWKDGVMQEEWLFWNNAEFMKQIGVQ